MNHSPDEHSLTDENRKGEATPPAPALQALNLGALEGIAGLADGAVCDIDDPDCEVPAAPAPAGTEAQPQDD